MAERERVDCPTCGRSVAVRWRSEASYVGLYDHIDPADSTGPGFYCGQPPFRPPAASPAPQGEGGLDEQALTAAHLAVEDLLVELRDGRISVLGPANGFVIRERDGEHSGIMRLGTRDGLRVAISAYLAAAAPAGETRTEPTS